MRFKIILEEDEDVGGDLLPAAPVCQAVFHREIL